MQTNPTPQRRPTKDYAPHKRKSRVLSLLPWTLAFVALLGVMYVIFPKEAGRSSGTTIYDGLIISEVMAANSSAVPDENGEFPDWLEIYNGTGADLNMEGVMLTNRTDRICFPFPAMVLKAGERVVVFASDSYQLDTSLPLHGKFKIASVGDHIYMYDPDMYLIDELVTPTLVGDESYAWVGNEANGERIYAETEYYSPGYENSEAGFVAYRAVNSVQGGEVVLNEICPAPRLGIPDEDGEVCDWVELYNNTDRAISLAGYALSDKENKPLKWRFPDSAVIPAHGYYLVFCSGKNKLQANGIPHTNFSISAERETLVLSDSQGRLIDRVSIENVPADYSVGRDETGAWVTFQLTSPSLNNDTAGQNRADEMYRAFNQTGVIISEVMASNDSLLLGASQTACDYVELYNSSTQTVDLSYYGLSDSITRPRKWQFPQGVTIAPGEYKIIYLDGQTELSTYYELHANFKVSRAGGETLTFCDPAGRVLDRLPLSLTPTDHSFGRTLGVGGFFYYDAPTPGAANGTGYYGYASNPSFSQRGGEYKGVLSLTIEIPKDTQVYYTLDGSIPTAESNAYNGETFEISAVTVLRARAFDPTGRLQPSEIITQTYLLNVYHSLPIVSLVTDPSVLWSETDGMLATGGEVVKEPGKLPFKLASGEYPLYRTIGKLARPGFVEMYALDGTQMLSQGMEFGLQGQYSLDMPQKTFKVKAKARYGARTFAAKLFDDLEFTEYKNFVLRNSGNDCVWTRMNDGLQSRLIDRFNEVTDTPTTVIHQAWNPVVVYLNGTYWGHYNMRERVDRYFVAQHEGLTLEQADDMDILEASGKVFYGSQKEYAAMIKKVKASSPGTNDADLQYILDNIDVDNYFDYMALEMFFGNSDPGNIRFYKLKAEGSKWKWIFYDADYGLFQSKFNSPKSYLKSSGAGQQNIDNTLLRKLLENDQMRSKFLSRLGEIFQVFTTEFMIAELDTMAAMLEPEMTLHFNRWAEENDLNINSDSPTNAQGALRYWYSRLDYTRNVMKKRPTYLYEMVQEQFGLSDEDMTLYFGLKPQMPADAKL